MVIIVLFTLFLVSFCSTASLPEEDLSLFEGDILLTPEEKFAIDNDLDPQSVASFGASKRKRWTEGIVPYTIADSLKQYPQALNVIASAMEEWSDKTCIRFVPRTNQFNYLEFFLGRSCASHIGMTGYKQKLSLGTLCWDHGVAVHEIGHALGFWHEQSRTDRDDHVTIVWENILDGTARNFKKYPKSDIDSLNMPYDYGSIMHYGRKAFSKNRQDTIVPKKKWVEIGQRLELSVGDLKQMNLMYNCPDKGTTQPTGSTTNGINIFVRSEGCGDPRLEASGCGKAYIKLNNKEYSQQKRGYNVVVVDFATGKVDGAYAYDTHGDRNAADMMAEELNNLVDAGQRKIILVAVQDEASSFFHSVLQKALLRVGGVKPLWPWYRGSYVLVGYSGSDSQPWVKQVIKQSGKGPSIVKMVIEK